MNNFRLYIDCGVRLGRTAKREALVPYDAGELTREMERVAIHAAMVESITATEYSYVRGNVEIAEICKTNPRLFQLVTCPPTYKWETPQGQNYLPNLLDGGARGVILRPDKLRHDLDPFDLEPVANELTPRGLPLVLYGTDEDYPKIRSVLQAFPELNVLIVDGRWDSLRHLFPMLDKFPNMHVDICCDQANDIADIMVKNFGANRIVYSSGYPRRVMSGLKTLIEYSALSEADKDLIAHGNACRLFKLDTPKPYDSCKMDEIEVAMTLGKPISDWVVNDVHGHVVDEDEITTAGVMMFNSCANSIVKKNDSLGIDKIVFSAWEGLSSGGARPNETVWRAIQNHPTRIYGYATANPNYEDDIDIAISYLEKHKNFVGLKPYSQLQGRKFNDPVYKPWFEYANKRRLFVLVHSGDQETANQINDIAATYPEVTFMMAHSAISFESARINVALAKKHPNVMLEITFTSMTRGAVEYMVREMGSERVFFGTDQPMRDPGPQLAWVVYAELNMEDKLNVLGRNMEKLLARTLPPLGGN